MLLFGFSSALPTADKSCDCGKKNSFFILKLSRKKWLRGDLFNIHQKKQEFLRVYSFFSIKSQKNK